MDNTIKRIYGRVRVNGTNTIIFEPSKEQPGKSSFDFYDCSVPHAMVWAAERASGKAIGDMAPVVLEICNTGKAVALRPNF